MTKRVSNLCRKEEDSFEMTHIFLSYQHDYEDMVVKLRDALKSCGFKTWFDRDDMGLSNLLLV